ncbi:UNVERIFIED_CONTAM: hypothetical protein Sradi_5078500 [Sesamum radiatum]|uniref:Uncharacterized protein n=1 Tax=Sesamum radiatum TaxID=300843 RepID=A0AAW2M418_SESRA
MAIEEPKLVDVIVQFCHATTAGLGTLATRIGFEHDASEKALQGVQYIGGYSITTIE